LDTRRLKITLERSRDGALHPDSTCPVHDVEALLNRVLESRTVLVERRDGAAPVRLRSRAARESEVAWLSRVLTAVLGQLTDTALAGSLVGDAIQRTAGVPVAIECWAPGQEAPRPVAAAPHSWPTWRGEIPLVRSARGVWMLVCPTGSTGLAAEYPALLAALTRCLCEADADDVRAQDALRQQLAHAVSGGDPAAFVSAAAQLLNGSVCLRDRTGAVVAASGLTAEASRTHEIVLRDESGLRGALVIDSVHNIGADLGLSDLALALLRLLAADSERSALENRLAVLGCFVKGGLDDPYAGRAGHARRMVLIRAVGSGQTAARSPSVGPLLRAAAASPLLAGLSLAPQDDALLGAYSDDGSDAEVHRRSWQRLLDAVERDGSLRVVVSTSTSSADDSRAQYETVSQVSHLQRDGADLFDLPAVAVIDQLGPLTGVLNAVPGAPVLPYVRRVLGDLITDGRFGGQLIDTLYAYLQTGGSPRGAGALLHLHGSSVKYRMRILRELLGERLDDPSKRFDIELALRLYLAGRELAAGPAR
jgi:hypothetical protein